MRPGNRGNSGPSGHATERPVNINLMKRSPSPVPARSPTIPDLTKGALLSEFGVPGWLQPEPAEFQVVGF